MSVFPLRHSVLHEAYIPGGRDELGNDAPAWAEPVEVKVIGWAPASRGDDGEPKRAGRDSFVVVDLELYTTADFKPEPRDKITIAGERFEAVGEAEEHTHGFHGWEPGNVVNLRRSEG